MNNIKLEFLPFSDAVTMILIGVALCLIYFYLLWQTVSVLRNVKNKGGFLFLSGTLRLFLIIFVMLFFSEQNFSKFIYMFIGFICTRSLILRFTKKSLKKSFADNEFAKAATRKGTVKTTRRKTIKRGRR